MPHKRRIGMTYSDMTWAQLNKKILACRKCGLSVHNPTPAYGDHKAAIMILGQSLHKEPNSVPFACASGRPISTTLAELGLGVIPWPPMGDEEPPKVLLTNVVHCFPADHKVTDSIIETCRPFLKRELALLKPHVVIALGTIARRTMEEIYGAYPRNNEVVEVLRPHLFIMGCMHPAAALRSEDVEDWKAMFTTHVKKAVSLSERSKRCV